MKPVFNLIAALTVAALSSSVFASPSTFASTMKPSCCTKGCCEEVGVDRTLTNGKMRAFVKAGEKAPWQLASLDTNPTKLVCKMGCCKSESVKENRWNGKRNEVVLVEKSTCTMPKGCCEDFCGKPVETSQLPARWIRNGKTQWFVKAGEKAPAWLESYDTAAKAAPNCCTSGKDCCTTS